MSKEYIAISEENTDKIISDQIDIYHGLQRKAQRFLRISIAVLTASVSLASLLITIILRGDIEIKSPAHYYNQTILSGAGDGEAALGLLIISLTGLIAIVISFIIALASLDTARSVLTDYSIYPYISGKTDQPAQLVSVKGKTNDVKSTVAELNDQAIRDMNSDIKMAYEYLTYSLLGLFTGAIAIISGYFAQIKIARMIAAMIFLIIMSISLNKALWGVLDIQTEKAQEKIERIDNGLRKVRKLITIAGGVGLFLLLSLFVLYFLDYLIFPLIIAVVVTTILFVPVIWTEAQERSLKQIL